MMCPLHFPQVSIWALLSVFADHWGNLSPLVAARVVWWQLLWLEMLWCLIFCCVVWWSLPCGRPHGHELLQMLLHSYMPGMGLHSYLKISSSFSCSCNRSWGLWTRAGNAGFCSTWRRCLSGTRATDRQGTTGGYSPNCLLQYAKSFRGKHLGHIPVGYSSLKVELNNVLFAISRQPSSTWQITIEVAMAIFSKWRIMSNHFWLTLCYLLLPFACTFTFPLTA